MTHYLIEFRFHGYAKKYLKQNILDISKRFKVRGITRKRIVPHTTLFGPFSTKNENKAIYIFLKVSKKYNLIPFKLKGFNHFGNKVVYVDIIPSNELNMFRKELANNLTNLREFFIIKTIKTEGISDYDENYPFHATIAFKDIERKFDKIWKYIKNKKPKPVNQFLLRITLLKNGKILYEYDFLQKRLLSRNEALNKNIWRRTISILKNATI